MRPIGLALCPLLLLACGAPGDLDTHTSDLESPSSPPSSETAPPATEGPDPLLPEVRSPACEADGWAAADCPKTSYDLEAHLSSGDTALPLTFAWYREAPGEDAWLGSGTVLPAAAFAKGDVVYVEAIARGASALSAPVPIQDTPPEALLAPGQPWIQTPWPGPGEGAGTLRFEGLPPGTFCGLAGWFALDLFEGVHLSTSPTDPPTHWGQVYLPIEPVEVRSGGVLEIDAEVRPSPEDRRGVDLRGTWSLGGRSGRFSHRVR